MNGDIARVKRISRALVLQHRSLCHVTCHTLFIFLFSLFIRDLQCREK